MSRHTLLYYCFFCLTIIAKGQSKSVVFDTTKTTDNLHFLAPRAAENQIIIHKGFSLSYNEEAEQAEWVFYKLCPSNFTTEIERTNDFREDPFVEKGSATLEDYYKSGYDRGHLAPAGSMKTNEETMSNSFFMSNISPQIPAFNRGVWKRLEEKIRFWVERMDSIFVVTGPVLDLPLDTIGHNLVLVPRAFFKTLLAFRMNKVTGIAFCLPNAASDQSLYTFATSIDSIESITGIDFYPNLDPNLQDSIEKNKRIKTFLND